MLITRTRNEGSSQTYSAVQTSSVLASEVQVTGALGLGHEVHKIPLTAWGFSGPASDVDGDGRSFKRILLAATNSSACMRAVSVAASLARGGASEVCVVHLIERVFLGRAGWCSTETVDEAQQLVSRFQADLEAVGVRVTARTGKARREALALEILIMAAEYRADVIVIGARRKSALRAVLFGSVSHQIVYRSKIPVVAVP
jgi:nucleotide-binding universal stress UspA family protein